MERVFEITPDNRFRWLDVELRINGRKVGEGPGVKFVFNDSSPSPGIYRLNSPQRCFMKGSENKWYFKADVLKFYHLDARPKKGDNVSIVYAADGGDPRQLHRRVLVVQQKRRLN